MRKLDKKAKATKQYGEPQDGRALMQVCRDIWIDQKLTIDKLAKRNGNISATSLLRELIDIGLKHYNDEQ